jgi:hypothetical protein
MEELWRRQHLLAAPFHYLPVSSRASRILAQVDGVTAGHTLFEQSEYRLFFMNIF